MEEKYEFKSINSCIYSVDIYSFAITMIEVMIWNDAFPRNEFQFSWNIADLIPPGRNTKIVWKPRNVVRNSRH